MKETPGNVGSEFEAHYITPQCQGNLFLLEDNNVRYLKMSKDHQHDCRADEQRMPIIAPLPDDLNTYVDHSCQHNKLCALHGRNMNGGVDHCHSFIKTATNLAMLRLEE
jgi:hypothetical protein